MCTDIFAVMSVFVLPDFCAIIRDSMRRKRQTTHMKLFNEMSFLLIYFSLHHIDLFIFFTVNWDKEEKCMIVLSDFIANMIYEFAYWNNVD